MTKIYTVGYQGVDLGFFIKALREKGITRLVDCRSYPWSRSREFTRKKLEKSLNDANIEYRWVPKLGGKEGKRPLGWNSALAHVIERANQGKIIALLCMEYDPTKCHRGKWIQPDLESKGVQVEHIFASLDRPKPNYSLEEFC